MSTQTANARQREAMLMTQAEAARRAGVSLATWRRWEEEPTSVKPSTAARCQKVLRSVPVTGVDWSTLIERFDEGDVLTPRQAAAFVSVLDWWLDMEVRPWLEQPAEPLYAVEPFGHLDPQVLMVVNENRTWVAEAAERLEAVSGEIMDGVLPFFRDGCFFDEVLMALTLPAARTYMDEVIGDTPELFEGLPTRDGELLDDDDLGGDRGERTVVGGDDDWDAIGDTFDDLARWDCWEVPCRWRGGHPVLPRLLVVQHPFTWFNQPAGRTPTLMGLATGSDLASAEVAPDGDL